MQIDKIFLTGEIKLIELPVVHLPVVTNDIETLISFEWATMFTSQCANRQRVRSPVARKCRLGNRCTTFDIGMHEGREQFV